MTEVLKGVRVLDVTRFVAGPICTALLADLGADVIRVEPPGGGDDRGQLPFAEGFHGGVGFTQCGRNKRGLTLDMASEKGRELFHRLLKNTDIVVANLPHSSIKSLGMDYDDMCKVKPDIIFVHLTTFGSEGPYKDRLGFDGIAQVMSGLTQLSGYPNDPMKSQAAWVDMTTGMMGAFGAMAALRHRDATGQGQKVEANLLQTALGIGNYFLIDQDFNKYDRTGAGNRALSGGPADLVKTKDGHVFMATLGNPMFKRFARMIGREEELVSNPKYGSDESRATHGLELTAIANEWAKDMTTDEVLDILAKNKIPAGPLLTPQQALDDAHIKENFITRVPVEGLSHDVPYIKPPVTLSKTPGVIRHGPPRPGQHNDELLAEAGYSPAEIEALKADKVI